MLFVRQVAESVLLFGYDVACCGIEKQCPVVYAFADERNVIVVGCAVAAYQLDVDFAGGFSVRAFSGYSVGKFLARYVIMSAEVILPSSTSASSISTEVSPVVTVIAAGQNSRGIS